MNSPTVHVFSPNEGLFVGGGGVPQGNFELHKLLVTISKQDPTRLGFGYKKQFQKADPSNSMCTSTLKIEHNVNSCEN